VETTTAGESPLAHLKVGAGQELRQIWTARLRRSSSRLSGVISLAGAVLVWHLAVVLFDIPEYLLPSPLAVLEELADRWDVLLTVHARATGVAMMVGFTISVIGGLALALAMTAWPLIEQAVAPILVALQSIPKIAVAPVIFIWMGFGMAPIVMITVLLTFFPIVISAVVGLKGTPAGMIALGKVVGLTPWQVFVKIRMPAALPEIFGGLKVAATLAVLGVIVAEFVSSQEGLGHVVLVSMAAINMPRAFAAIVLIIAMSLLLFKTLELLEELMMPWRRAQRDQR
jgi:NitT/TauT family transport system permease protein